MARVHTQLYLSIESNRKICRLQLGRLSIRKTTETIKPKSSPSPLQDRDRDWEVLGQSGASVVSGSGPETLREPDTRPASAPPLTTPGGGVNPFTIAPHASEGPQQRAAGLQHACDDNAQLVWSNYRRVEGGGVQTGTGEERERQLA